MLAGMSYLEIAAVATALIMVIFQIRQSPWLYPFGIASSLMYAVLFWQWGLPATAMLQAIFVALLVYGWVYWLKHGPETPTGDVKRLGPAGWVIAIVATQVLAVVWGSVLYKTAEANIVFADAPLAAASVLGQWLLARKYVDNWLVWIAVNAGYAGLLAYQKVYLSSGLYIVFFALAVWGYIAWLRTPNSPRGFDVLPAK